MIYLTADLHGDLDRLQQARKPLRRHDSLIVLGDFGFIWNGSKAEQKLLRRLGKGKGTLLFLDGAHENFDLLAEYPVVEFAGGQARKLGERLYQLLRGECYTIEGRRLLCMGGGESADTADRQQGVSWWPQELPDDADFARCRASLAAQAGKVDYILTHTPPYRLRRFLVGEEGEINRLEAFLDELADEADYRCWYFGQLHLDRAIGPRAVAVYRKVLPLWVPPKKKLFHRSEQK